MHETIRVDLGDRSYDVLAGSGTIGHLGEAVAAVRDVSSVAIVTDSNVGPLYADRTAAAARASGKPCSVIEFPAGEDHKNLATMGFLFDRLYALEPAFDRSGLIVTLGGGVVGDAGGRKMGVREAGLRYRDHADAAAGRQHALDERHLQQRGGGDRDPRRIGELSLEQGEKSAGGGGPIGAVGDQFPRRGNEIRGQAFGAAAHDPVGGSAADNLVQYRKRPGGGIADIARNSWKPAVQHQDSDGRAVHRFAALYRRLHDLPSVAG